MGERGRIVGRTGWGYKLKALTQLKRLYISSIIHLAYITNCYRICKTSAIIYVKHARLLYRPLHPYSVGQNTLRIYIGQHFVEHPYGPIYMQAHAVPIL